MKYAAIIVAVLVILGLGGFFLYKKTASTLTQTTPTPTEEPIQMLEADKQPKVSLSFSADSHFVTVNLNNLHADAIEYDLVYDATLKRNGITSQVNTGVNASEKTTGKNSYNKEQLLGSESSGKRSYHEDIKNAMMNLTLRDSAGRSIFTATYPFMVTAGKTVELTASE